MHTVDPALLRELNTGSMAKVVNRFGDEFGARVKVVRGKYRFATQGGAIGDIALLDDNGDTLKLPDNAVVVRNMLDVHTVPDSAADGSTVALKAESAADLLAATAEASVTGVLAGKLTGDGTGMFKTTAERTVYATVAAEALTSGSFDVYIWYFEGLAS